MAYRDDHAALESRRDDLRHEITSIQSKARELEGLVKGEAALKRELADVETRIAKAATRRLPMLDDIRIASPCSADWADMHGDERVRFCDNCDKNVYNLSAMTRAEAEALVLELEGNLCVRMYQRLDGTVVTNDCPVGVRKKRVRRVALAAVSAGAMAAASFIGIDREQPAVATSGIEIPTNLGERAQEDARRGEVPVVDSDEGRWVGGAASLGDLERRGVLKSPPRKPAPRLKKADNLGF